MVYWVAFEGNFEYGVLKKKKKKEMTNTMNVFPAAMKVFRMAVSIGVNFLIFPLVSVFGLKFISLLMSGFYEGLEITFHLQKIYFSYRVLSKLVLEIKFFIVLGILMFRNFLNFIRRRNL